MDSPCSSVKNFSKLFVDRHVACPGFICHRFSKLQAEALAINFTVMPHTQIFAMEFIRQT
jgi:hypothetical protein